jgi:hypothetical protein
MNIDNIEKALYLKIRIQDNEQAIKDIDKLLIKFPHGNSDGKNTSRDGKIYNLYVSEYTDGSGCRINLTGSMIQTELLESVMDLLNKQIEKDKKEIESL